MGKSTGCLAWTAVLGLTLTTGASSADAKPRHQRGSEIAPAAFAGSAHVSPDTVEEEVTFEEEINANSLIAAPVLSDQQTSPWLLGLPAMLALVAFWNVDRKSRSHRGTRGRTKRRSSGAEPQNNPRRRRASVMQRSA